MLSRYFSLKCSAKSSLLTLLITAGLVSAAHANSRVLLDSTGKPLPDDFGALIQLLDESESLRKQRLLDRQQAVASKPANATTSREPVGTDKVTETATKKPKNPAFYNPELARRLYDALSVGDAARTKWLLKSGAGNVYVTDKKDTSLRLAIRKRWASVVRVLLEREPDLKQTQSGNVNLLHEASVQGAYDIAKMLIEAGIDPKEKTQKNWTNLHLAARYGHINMVRYYLSLGLDPDARNSEGNTAHWLASHLRHYQAAGYLASRTNVTSHQIFDGGKGKKKTSKRRNKKRQKASQAFSPAQLEALRNL